MLKLALFGSPVRHSLSPLVHELFAQAENKKIAYELKETFSGQLAQAISAFKNAGGMGANITLPLKVEAFHLCQRLTQSALAAQAVNTLYWQEDLLWGDNTDGRGLINDLTLNLKVDLKNKKILLLGAGGAARGILFPLLDSGVNKIILINRTLSSAQSLASLDPQIEAFSYEGIEHSPEKQFDLVVNATSASLQDQLPPLSPHWLQGAIVVDLAYKHQEKTIFFAMGSSTRCRSSS